jgi:hypothetical protein
VSYILIGGLAAAAHGSPVETDDVDICLPPEDDENLKRLGLALDDLGARPASDSTGEHRVSFNTIWGRLDCLENPIGFADLDTKAAKTDLGRGVFARVASIEDLSEFKRASTDLVSAAHLAALATSARQAEEDQLIAASEPAKPRKVDRIWKLLEDVDTFLTDLDRGQLRRNRRPT